MSVSSQSGTTPFAIDEPSTHSLSSISFLLGTRPDACILVVNSIDPDEYIQDTIDVIRAVGKAPVILLAMSDKEKHVRSAYERSWVTQRQMSRAEIDARVNELQNRFDMPAIEIVSIDGQQKMTDVVIDYFAADGKTAA